MLCNEKCTDILERFDKLSTEVGYLVTTGWADSKKLDEAFKELKEYSSYSDTAAELTDLIAGDAEDLELPGVIGTQIENESQADPSELFESIKNIAKVLKRVRELNIDQFNVTKTITTYEKGTRK